MTTGLENELTVNNLKDLVYREELYLILDKIKNAARNFKTETYITADYKLREGTIGSVKKLGYSVEIKVHIDDAPYKYTYRIFW